MLRISSYRGVHPFQWVGRAPLVLVVIASVFGCVSYSSITEKVNTPIDDSAVRRIVVGETTLSEIYRLFGPPHSIFQGQVELKENKVLPLEPGMYYSHGSNRYLTSIDENYIAVLYRFGESGGRSLAFAPAPFVAVYRNTEVTLRGNEVLIFVDKAQPHIVRDIAFHKVSGAKQ